MWATKHGRLVGNESVRKRFTEWLQDFLDRKPRTKRGAFLIGPAGTGKTMAAYQTLQAAGCQIVEQNAGAVRTRKSFETTILETVNSGPLFGRSNALFLPNVDVINPSLGGLEVIMCIVNPLRGLNRAIRASDRVEAETKRSIPIVLTSNSVPKGRLADLENDCETFIFERLSMDDLFALAQHVLAEEGVSLSEDRVKSACRAAEGDARSLLNILQTGYLESTDKALTVLESSLRLVFPKDPVTAQTIFDATETDVLGTTSTFFENYLGTDGELRARDAQLLAESDLVEATLFRKQDWSLLPYVGLIGCTPAMSRQPSKSCILPKRLSRRSDESASGALFHGSTRSKSTLIGVKQKQLADLRSRMLIEGHADASVDRVGYLSTALTLALCCNDVSRVTELLKATGLSASTAESLLRTVGLKPLRARDKSSLKRCEATLRETGCAV